MTTKKNAWLLLAIASLVFGAVAASAATPKGCAGVSSCAETRSFVARVTSFRTSVQGKNRVVTATVRFENRTDKPLTLGYVRDSGLALDDHGNRYTVPAASSVRAIGEISGTSFDPKFTLPAGEGSDARFELMWEPGKEAVGASFELDLAIREIAPLTGEQFRLAQEHAIHFASLTQSTAKPTASAATPAAAAAAPKDPCGASPRCYNAGGFIAEVMQVSATAMTAGVRHQSVAINIRFRNVSDKPMILAYRSASSAGLDNFGNGFTWGRPGTHDTSVKGIGTVAGKSVDTQFSLTPGQSRSATFNIIRFNAAPPIGNSYNYDVVIDEIEVLPGQMVRSARQNSMSFAKLSPGTFSASSAGSAPSVAEAVNGTAATDATDVANKVIDFLNRVKKH